ncbi:yggV [Wigglesworthia glossinidia endosymbiont of Glossina brevipalpis]|uniref:dITP/XTP pyrophosphatase n=1 Tax=Wigglesworthia glossinidia brevipalpis TaxID=36870 RepID=IXTPA_WIGBR|nr:RecName: Full=dITP/XTP pyrophosphatase; AltName: Full=Non-canonical purine NTP pyrophosphatase; AltName: Full=Non-standard purine NTP pyrophosphatase; AltName: Full=Nucleoside-triphosphate diphosphatase; AltName: Full=Nucleoside-triphosphate pyrophosphatase; Short=NTPase [Wigglesworthia glossinidia endosymbiont of Glossina brevipalpis]BAC24224.1 yggV [Wigglesworthia glossinidia endosymbiont of Glossina brevipalpis]
MKKIILATSNKNKIIEFKKILSELNINTISQKDLGICSIEENKSTFLENALIKARNASKYGFPALSDDSGLIIKTLNGEPGVYSSRFSGNQSNDIKNINMVLKKMLPFKKMDRQACMHCVLIYIRNPNDPIPIISSGTIYGKISNSISKINFGFGYDSIFFLPKKKKTISELTLEEKIKISHRGIAMKKMIKFLKNEKY